MERRSFKLSSEGKDSYPGYSTYECRFYIGSTNSVCSTCSLKGGYCSIKCNSFTPKITSKKKK